VSADDAYERTRVLKWIFVLDDDYAWQSGRTFAEDCAYEDSSGKRRLEIRKNGELRVLKGYAWDGCTPKFSMWDICVGTPDGVPNAVTKRPKAYYASLLHDALYQFSIEGLPAPLDRRSEIDRIFLEILERDGFAPRKLYYWAVRVFAGGIFYLYTRRKRGYKGRKVPL
jgi:hypothetical protein